MFSRDQVGAAQTAAALASTGAIDGGGEAVGAGNTAPFLHGGEKLAFTPPTNMTRDAAAVMRAAKAYGQRQVSQ